MVRRDQIRSYVAQDDMDGSAEYHAFRAVRRVDVRAGFAPGAEGLGVVDLPGLGDTNLGDSATVLHALQDDVDVVLFVREPAARGDDIQEFDIDLYALAKDALPEIPMDQRSFLIINHVRSEDQDNLPNARRYKARIDNPRSPIRVVRSEIVDCSDSAEVAAAFDPVVDYLLQHADRLDGLLIAERLRATADLEGLLDSLVKQAGVLAVQAQPDADIFDEFQDLFDRAYDALTISLEQLVDQLRRGEYRPDMSFEGSVSTVIRLAEEKHGIPPVAEITRRIYRGGGRATAFSGLLNESRAHLSRYFLQLDGALKAQVAQMQQDVADRLAGPGELAPLSDRTGRDFLLDIAERVHPAAAVAAEEEAGERAGQQGAEQDSGLDTEREKKEKEIAFALRMLARNGAYHRLVNNDLQVTDEINSLLRSSDRERLVILTLLKSETYLETPESTEQFMERVKDAYSPLLGDLAKDGISDRVGCVIAAVKTIGPIRVYDVDVTDPDDPVFRFHTTRVRAAYAPEDTDQPLRYLLTFVINKYRSERNLMERTKEWATGLDQDLVKAVDEFADGCKNGGPVVVLQDHELLHTARPWRGGGFLR
ncbi:MAG TPA: hypothetical protein VIZ43_19045 [Trebonia sp.]